MNLEPAIFDSFNAKNLSPQQVANSFVPPDAKFKKLMRGRNSVLLGPRGSGKTTMLKMLLQEALENWEHPEFDRYVRNYDYTAIFIPMDERFSNELKEFGKGNLTEEASDIIKAAVYSNTVLLSLLSSIQARLSKKPSLRQLNRVDLTEGQIKFFVSELKDAWRLNDVYPDLVSVKSALRKRMIDIYDFGNTLKDSELSKQQELIKNHPYINLKFIQMSEFAIGLFNDIVDQEHSKWVFCFDELELAPDNIYQYLINLLRKPPEKYLLKLALAPSVRYNLVFGSDESPLAGNDYDPIKLWYSTHNEIKSFCENLWYNMLKDREMDKYDPYVLFNISEIEYENDNKNVYKAEAPTGKLFIKHYKEDPSFKKYLDSNDIDVYNLDKLPGRVRAAHVRKVKPIILLREEYLKIDQDFKRRTRKLNDLYSGTEVLFTVTEGNPRWFIGIFESLLDMYQLNGKVTKNEQAKILKTASSKYNALLKTVPIGQTDTIIPNGILSIIRQISKYINNQYYSKKFKPAPVSTFTVDSNISSSLESLLITAQRIGAIIYLPDENTDLHLTSVKGKRFRLTYLLAPTYNLPLTNGPSVNLFTMLKPKEKTQTSIFYNDENTQSN